MRKTLMILLTMLLFFAFASVSLAGNKAALKNRLAYLNNIEEVSEVKFIDNQVYIGFNWPVQDMGMIVGAAAAFGSEAYGSMITVWGCEYNANISNPKNWNVYRRGKCYAIGRGGQARTNRCQ